MSAYGVHPTQFERLSDSALYSMFRESTYSRLSEDQKLDLLQETVNRDALQQGEAGAPEVRFANLPANVSGNAANGVITVNRDLAVNGMQSVVYNGQLLQHPVSDYNIQTLNTVLHENKHCLQDQIIDGTVKTDNAQLANEYRANSFTSSPVYRNGCIQQGSQYMTGETASGYYMYYFQATERDAFLYAEEKTESILSNIKAEYGSERSFEAYEKSVAATGYQTREQEAISLFQNTNFEKDLNQVLQNQYFGTNTAVDPTTENAVKAEMIATYSNLQPQIAQVNTFAQTDVLDMDTYSMSIPNGDVQIGSPTDNGSTVDNDNNMDCGLDI